MATIVIDAGHGGADPGAVFEGRQEKDDTLRLALAVGKILEENGQNVIYTRTTDVYQTPFQKATIGNEARADFFVSIHRNSSPVAGQYSGVETLVYERSGIKEEMAENINRELEEAGFKNLGKSRLRQLRFRDTGKRSEVSDRERIQSRTPGNGRYVPDDGARRKCSKTCEGKPTNRNKGEITIRNFRIVQTEGSRQVTCDTKDYTIKGWVMDDE